MSNRVGKPRLCKRGEWWYALWNDRRAQGTRRLSLGTKDETEAQIRFAAFLKHGAELRNDGPSEDGYLIDDILDAYVDEHVRHHVRASDRQEFAIRNLRDFFGSMTVAEVTPDVIAQYCRRREAGKIGKPSKSSTHRRELNVLQAALNHGVRTRRLKPGELPYIKLPPSAPPKDRWLTHDELARLIEAARRNRAHRLDDRGRLTRMHRFLALAYYTASRRGALEALTWFQVDLAQGRIKLARDGEAQTAKRRPTLPISPRLLPILKQAHAERRNEYVLDRPGPILQEFQRFVRKLGWSDVTPHTLRHTRAVHLAQQGVPLYSIAGLLGDTVETVQRNYLHHCPAHLQDVLAVDGAPDGTDCAIGPSKV